MDKINNKWNGKIIIWINHLISNLNKRLTDHFNMRQCLQININIKQMVQIRSFLSLTSTFVAELRPSSVAHKWYSSLPPNAPLKKSGLYIIGVFIGLGILIWAVPLTTKAGSLHQCTWFFSAFTKQFNMFHTVLHNLKSTSWKSNTIQNHSMDCSDYHLTLPMNIISPTLRIWYNSIQT